MIVHLGSVLWQEKWVPFLIFVEISGSISGSGDRNGEQEASEEAGARIVILPFPLKKHNPATEMLAGTVGYSTTRKKILLKGRNGR
jgi:hypothetical protein